jgi:hypothetical protein
MTDITNTRCYNTKIWSEQCWYVLKGNLNTDMMGTTGIQYCEHCVKNCITFPQQYEMKFRTFSQEFKCGCKCSQNIEEHKKNLKEKEDDMKYMKECETIINTLQKQAEPIQTEINKRVEQCKALQKQMDPIQTEISKLIEENRTLQRQLWQIKSELNKREGSIILIHKKYGINQKD